MTTVLSEVRATVATTSVPSVAGATVASAIPCTPQCIVMRNPLRLNTSTGLV